MFRFFSAVGTSASCFTLAAALGAGPAAAANPDPITGSIFNNISYAQTSNAQPGAPFGYWFNIQATFSTPGDYAAGSASYPGGAQTLSLVGPTFLNYQTAYLPSAAAVSALFPLWGPTPSPQAAGLCPQTSPRSIIQRTFSPATSPT